MLNSISNGWLEEIKFFLQRLAYDVHSMKGICRHLNVFAKQFKLKSQSTSSKIKNSLTTFYFTLA